MLQPGRALRQQSDLIFLAADLFLLAADLLGLRGDSPHAKTHRIDASPAT